MIIDVPIHIEQIITEKAQAQGISVAELIVQTFDKPKQAINPMVARALALPKSSSFDGIDAVELQRQWRDEWR